MDSPLEHPAAGHARFFPAPADLRPWTAGAVALHLPASIGASRFPASLGGMLVVRLDGQCHTVAGQVLAPVSLFAASPQPTRYAQSGRISACGLLLEPHAARVISAQSNLDLCGGVFDLDHFQPGEGARLHDRLASASTDDDRCRLLFSWLRMALAARPRLTAGALLLGPLPALLARGLDTACLELGVGARQLERRCLDALGMPPKRAQAILRLHATLRSALQAERHTPGAELALNHHYFDQSHMARDMRRLAGTSVSQVYRASQAAVDEHWAFGVGRQQAGL